MNSWPRPSPARWPSGRWTSGKLDAAADLTARVVRDAYPDLNVPFHARWRHFVVDGRDLWAEREKPWSDPKDTRPRRL